MWKLKGELAGGGGDCRMMDFMVLMNEIGMTMS